VSKTKAIVRDPSEPLRAVAYVRCSSEKQADKESSLPAQKVEIERLAARSGGTVVRWFQDDGISGKDMLHRPGVTEMLTYMEENHKHVDALYLYDYKRLARNREDAYYIRKKAAKLKIAIVSVAQPIVDDPVGAILQESMYDAFAEIERLNNGRSVRRGLEQTLRAGYWPYRLPPYGYRVIGIANSRGTERFKLVPDPITGPVVKRIFELQAQGLGQKLIAAALDREGAPCPSRKDVPKERVQGWRPKHVGKILADPRYLGHALWDREVVSESNHDALIDRETFDRAQGLAAARRRNPSELGSLNTKNEGVFRPWLRCGTCGGPMVVNRGGAPTNRVWYYACSTRIQKKDACTGLTVRVDELDPALFEVMEAEVLTEENVVKLIESALTMMNGSANQALADRRSTLAAVLDGIDAQMQKITRAIGAGVIDLEDAREQTEPLRKRRADLREELAGLPEPQRIPTLDEIDTGAFRDAILRNWHANEQAVQRKALDRLIVEVQLSPGMALIRYSWKAEPTGYTYQVPFGPPYAPRSLAVPSASKIAGSPASRAGEAGFNVKSSLSQFPSSVALKKRGSALTLDAPVKPS